MKRDNDQIRKEKIRKYRRLRRKAKILIKRAYGRYVVEISGNQVNVLGIGARGNARNMENFAIFINLSIGLLFISSIPMKPKTPSSQFGNFNVFLGILILNGNSSSSNSKYSSFIKKIFIAVNAGFKNVGELKMNSLFNIPNCCKINMLNAICISL